MKTRKLQRESSARIPPGEPVELDTIAEAKRVVAEQNWRSVPQQSREDLMFQTQSVSYRDWMTEDLWDTPSRQEATTELSISDFEP